jgi:hypothetical protein
LSGVLSTWKVLFGIAGALVAAMAGFVLPMPSSDQTTVASLVRFLIALLVAVLAIGMTNHSRRSDVRLWLIGGLGALVVGLAALGGYAASQSAWVSPCGTFGRHAKESMVIGSKRTPEGNAVYALARAQYGPDPTPAQMLDGAYSARSKLWDRTEVTLRTAVLIALYIASMLLLSGASVALIQAAIAAGAFGRSP